MKFETMADVEAYYTRLGELIHLRVQANDLCNALCHKLDWTHDAQTTHRINCALARARVRLMRREQLS
jgi:hypothetical protein